MPIHDIVTYTCDLGAPVEKNLGADVTTVFADVVKETAEGHELRDEHHLGGHTDGEDTNAVCVFDGGHDASLLQELLVLRWRRALLEDFDRHGDLDVLVLRHPHALETRK